VTSAEAREALISGSDAEKREAARWLARNAGPEDRSFVAQAAAGYPDHWVLRALNDAISRLDGPRPAEETREPADEPIDAALALADAYARGVRDTSYSLVHELRRFVGLAKLSASDLSAAYDGSEAQQDLDRLSALLDAIELLGRAARSTAADQFDLSELMLEVASHESDALAVAVQRHGPRPLMMVGDRSLVELIARAGIRNACEAVIDLGVSEEIPVVLTWDSTDRDVWFVVLDRGPGPPAHLLDPFEFAATTKDGADHFGIGLALARRAATTLGGNVTLRGGATGGAIFEARFPLIPHG
jgi:signal transduction histidine kinase